ncbi:MAG: hypothetical protein HUU25_06780 [Candidatus Sumerlaeia bacterium]|nr:hypothetical protein [Candidatus Sumerlaeia bacterium]
MPPGEFTVRVTAKGEIVFDMTGLSQEQIRLTREMAEEMLGKIIAEGAPAEPPPPGHVSADTGERPRLPQRG